MPSLRLALCSAIACACATAVADRSGLRSATASSLFRRFQLKALEATFTEDGSGRTRFATAFQEGDDADSLVVRSGVDRSGVAWARFDDTLDSTGWSGLTVETNARFSDEEQAAAAGMVEGWLTHQRIKQMVHNVAGNRDPSAAEGMKKYHAIQRAYVEEHVRAARADDSKDADGFWHQAHLMLRQLDGLHKGYNAACCEADQLDLHTLWLLNMDGDNMELERAVSIGAVDLSAAPAATSFLEGSAAHTTAEHDSDPMAGVYSPAPAAGGGALHFRERSVSVGAAQAPAAPARMLSDQDFEHDESRDAPSRQAAEERVWAEKMLRSRCSALVKLLPDNADILVAHTSWEDYVLMMRVFKHYRLNYRHASTRAKSVSMSSYPGMISSTDDWYVTSAGLLATETTVNLMRDDILSRMRARALASWIRAVIASRMADTAPEWARLYARENSGTYNCHWMIVDYGEFEPGKPLKPNTFYVTETVPGLAVGDDMTDVLEKRTFWPSVNRPYFRRVRAAAGYRLKDQLVNGVDFLSFERNPRGQQIAAMHESVKGSSAEALAAMKRLIRHNDPQGDRLQRGKTSYALAARYDLLEGPDRAATGATDAKIAGWREVHSMRTHAINGPTTQNGHEPFSFTGEWASIPHDGMPAQFDFDWQVVQPAAFT